MQILHKCTCAPLYFIHLDTPFGPISVTMTRLRDQNAGYYLIVKQLFHLFTSLLKTQPEKKGKQIIRESAIHMQHSFACQIWCLGFSVCGDNNLFSILVQSVKMVCVCVFERERGGLGERERDR